MSRQRPQRQPSTPRRPTLRRARGSVGLDVLGFSQFGPALDLELMLPSRFSLGVTARLPAGGVLAHYIPKLYPGEGRLLTSYLLGLHLRRYLIPGRYHQHAGFFLGALFEVFRYRFENGKDRLWSPPETQDVHLLLVGLTLGQRWDFRGRFFVTLHGALGLPIVVAFRHERDDCGLLTDRPRDADAVPPVAIRLALNVGLFF